MEKNILEEYLDIKREIRDLEQRIEKRNAEILTDTVVGSSPEYPYTAHSISIRGVAADDALMLRRRRLLEELRKKEGEIEAFIEQLPSRERSVVRYRVFDGMSWRRVSAKTKYSVATARRIYEKAVDMAHLAHYNKE